MLGAITGDIIGSRFEFRNHRSKEFELFGGDCGRNKVCYFTDDTVMTVAVADALLAFDSLSAGDEAAFKAKLVERMLYHGRRYPGAGWGGRFIDWLFSSDQRPYGSYGNGSAMRVSPVGFYASSLADAEMIAAWTAEVSHNHPEGVKGAQAVAAAVYMARTGKSKTEISEYISSKYYPENRWLAMSCDEIRAVYHFDETCQNTVPPAIVAFLEASSFEDAARLAVSLGGDTDTLTDITCAMAEAFWGIPEEIAARTLSFLDVGLRGVCKRFIKRFEA